MTSFYTQKKTRAIFFLIIVTLLAGVFVSIRTDLAYRTASRVDLELGYLSYKLGQTEDNSSLFAFVGSAISSIYKTNSYNINDNSEPESASYVPVLVYHTLPNDYDGLNVSKKMFEDQMFTLKKNGWETVSLSEYMSFVKGEKELPEKSFLLTFDDGARESYFPADPLLRFLGYQAVMFVLPKHSLEKRTDYYLSKNDLEQMKSSGRWELQPHGYESHGFVNLGNFRSSGSFMGNKKWLPELGRLETDEEFKIRISNDMSLSGDLLESELGIDSYAFAYPFGDFGQRAKNFPDADLIVKEESGKIYNLLFAQIEYGVSKLITPLDEDSFLISRLKVDPAWTGADLLKRLDNLPVFLSQNY